MVKSLWLPTAPEEPETLDVVAKTLMAVQPPVPPPEDIKAISVMLLDNHKIVESHPRNVLAFIEKEKKLSMLKIWLEYEKSKIINKAQKERSVLAVWTSSKKAALEAIFSKQLQEQKDLKKKAEYYEKMDNKIALVKKQSEEKKAQIQAKFCKKMVKIQAKAANYRQRETTPNKFLGCFCV